MNILEPKSSKIHNNFNLNYRKSKIESEICRHVHMGMYVGVNPKGCKRHLVPF